MSIATKKISRAAISNIQKDRNIDQTPCMEMAVWARPWWHCATSSCDWQSEASLGTIRWHPQCPKRGRCYWLQTQFPTRTKPETSKIKKMSRNHFKKMPLDVCILIAFPTPCLTLSINHQKVGSAHLLTNATPQQPPSFTLSNYQDSFLTTNSTSRYPFPSQHPKLHPKHWHLSPYPTPKPLILTSQLERHLTFPEMSLIPMIEWEGLCDVGCCWKCDSKVPILYRLLLTVCDSHLKSHTHYTHHHNPCRKTSMSCATTTEHINHE